MILSELYESSSFYSTNDIYVHGGPLELDGGKLKRYGRNHQDYGALFFCKNDKEGLWYASTYTNKTGKVYFCKIKTPKNQILDLTNSKSVAVLREDLSTQKFD